MRRWLACLAAAATVAAAQDRPSTVSTEIRVHGEVRNELRMTVAELQAFGRDRGAVDERGYTGVRLTDLLARAGIREDARHALRRTVVVATSTDGYKAVFSWGELFNTPLGNGVLVTFLRDGQPLRDGEGRIALVSTNDLRVGARHVKWLQRIEVLRIPE